MARKLNLEKVFIIAEMAQTHEGSFDLARAITDAASEADADAIKYQVFAADELAVPTYQHYDLYKKIEFSDDQWKQLVNYAKHRNLLVLADVFGERSADLMQRLEVDGFKIHSSDIVNYPLLSQVAKFKKTIFLSTGGSTQQEVARAIEIIKKEGNEKICLIHGYQSYPTRLEDSELNRIRLLRDKYRLPVGFADHIDGDSPLATILPLMAIVAGATVIEKHITLDRSLKGEDYYSSLNPDEFKKMVEMLRKSEKAVGKPRWEMSESELSYRMQAKKRIVARKNLKKGEKLSFEMLAFKRVDSEEPIFDVDILVGKVLKRDIAANSIIRLEDVE